MNLKRAIFYTLVCTYTAFSAARELTDLSLEVTTAKTGNEAKQEAFDRAVEQATQQLTEELLGPERTAKVWASIRPKLLKNSTRYVVFIKGSAPQESGGGSRVQVQMRVSSDNLETLLREYGALGQGTVRLLPLVVVSEPKGSHYAWWADHTDENSLAKDLFKKVFSQINKKFKGKNVYVLDPTSSSFRMSVPAAHRSQTLGRDDQILLGQYLKADIVVGGKVEIQHSDEGGVRAVYDLHLWQTKSGRSLTDARRTEDVASDVPKVLAQAVEDGTGRVAEELAAKLNDAILSGALNLNVIRLVIEGSMGYRQHSELKKMLGSLRTIKTVKERRFEPSRLTLEVETRGTSAELAKQIAKTNFPQYRVDVDSVQDQGLVLSVRALSSSSAL